MRAHPTPRSPRRPPTRLGPGLATGLLAGVIPLVAAAPAAALSCVGIEGVLRDAEQAYTGRIVDAQDGVLQVAVDEVWRGGPVEDRVWLEVQLAGWSEWAGPDGEVPDGYSSPATWLFAPDDGAVGPCTAWRTGSAYVDRHRPDRTEEPVADGALDGAGEAPAPTGEEVPWALVTGLGGGGAVAAALGVVLVRRYRRR